MDQLQFRVLNELFEEGETYVAELECFKKAEKEKRLRKVTEDSARSTFTRTPRKMARMWTGAAVGAGANEGDGGPRRFRPV